MLPLTADEEERIGKTAPKKWVAKAFFTRWGIMELVVPLVSVGNLMEVIVVELAQKSAEIPVLKPTAEDNVGETLCIKD